MIKPLPMAPPRAITFLSATIVPAANASHHTDHAQVTRLQATVKLLPGRCFLFVTPHLLFILAVISRTYDGDLFHVVVSMWFLMSHLW